METTADIEVCQFEFDRSTQSSKAKTVEVTFEQECKKQMVTVCKPTYHQPPPPPYDPYNPYAQPKQPEVQVFQQCKEVAQETCYNIPKLIEKEIDVTMGFPSSKRDCKIQTVTIPEIKCEDIVESKCQDIPRFVW